LHCTASLIFRRQRSMFTRCTRVVGRACQVRRFSGIGTRWVEESKNLAPVIQVYKQQGWVHLPWGFLDEAACLQEASFARRYVAEGKAFHSTESHTCYQEEQDPSFPPDHCRNALQVSEKLIVDYAKLEGTSPVKLLYQDLRFRRMISEIVGLPDLHLSACPFNAAYMNVFEDGHGLGWHFDRSEFGVNLILSAPSGGADFEFHYHTRSEEDLFSYGKVSEVLDAGSSHPEVTKPVDVKPGDVVIFNGRLNMHRVTPVKGADPRVNAIFTFEKQPGARGNAYMLKKFFGRTLKEQEAHM